MSETGGCKVELVTERYGLDGSAPRGDTLDERLLARWTGNGAGDGPAEGYRTLTTWFNKRLLKRAYDDHGRETTGARLESDFEALTGDDDLVREEVLDSLRAAGIDADRLLDDFVSWSTMRHHLKGCLDAEKPDRAADTDWERESVTVAKGVTSAKVDEALRSLDAKRRLPGGEDVGVDIQVLLRCPECPTRIPFADAVERGFVCADHLGAAPEDGP